MRSSAALSVARSSSNRDPLFSLSFDHRLIDGAPAARFLQDVKRLIEKPYLILIAERR